MRGSIDAPTSSHAPLAHRSSAQYIHTSVRGVRLCFVICRTRHCLLTGRTPASFVFWFKTLVRLDISGSPGGEHKARLCFRSILAACHAQPSDDVRSTLNGLQDQPFSRDRCQGACCGCGDGGGGGSVEGSRQPMGIYGGDVGGEGGGGGHGKGERDLCGEQELPRQVIGGRSSLTTSGNMIVTRWERLGWHRELINH